MKYALISDIHANLPALDSVLADIAKRGPDAKFWPDQVLCDAVACLAVIATMGEGILRN